LRKHVKARREKLRKLAEADAANRCAFCRRAKPQLEAEGWHSQLISGTFCTFDCLVSAEQKHVVMEKVRR